MQSWGGVLGSPPPPPPQFPGTGPGGAKSPRGCHPATLARGARRFQPSTVHFPPAPPPNPPRPFHSQWHPKPIAPRNPDLLPHGFGLAGEHRKTPPKSVSRSCPESGEREVHAASPRFPSFPQLFSTPRARDPPRSPRGRVLRRSLPAGPAAPSPRLGSPGSPRSGPRRRHLGSRGSTLTSDP